MKIASITSSKLSGIIAAPPSKSFSHRAIICGALSGGDCNISSVMLSQDVVATISGMRAIGSNVFEHEGSLDIYSFIPTENKAIIDCYDCGATLRFLIPIVAVLNINAVFKRSHSLAKRPIDGYLKILSDFGVMFQIHYDLSIEISGKLEAGNFKIPGDVSSQFVSGLLMALPMCSGNSSIEITSKLESSKYVDMTIEVMKRFGVEIKKTDKGFFIKGNQQYKPTDYVVEGDWSQAAFFMAAGALGGSVSVENLSLKSTQADKEILNLLSKFGADVFWENNVLNVRAGSLTGIDIDASEIPDLVPIISVLAANAQGVTNIKNATRLRLKESDRLKSTAGMLKSLGAKIKENKDGLTVVGKERLTGGTTCGYGDHRIVMAAAIAACNCENSVCINGCEAVIKSYPYFFEDYNLLGGKAVVIGLG